MSLEIEARLSEYGVCLLGAGTYFVSGVRMPDGSTVSGMGSATRIVLMDFVESGAAIELGSFCTVRNLFPVRHFALDRSYGQQPKADGQQQNARH